jgi:hypothetical protein
MASLAQATATTFKLETRRGLLLASKTQRPRQHECGNAAVSPLFDRDTAAPSQAAPCAPIRGKNVVSQHKSWRRRSHYSRTWKKCYIFHICYAAPGRDATNPKFAAPNCQKLNLLNRLSRKTLLESVHVAAHFDLHISGQFMIRFG